MYNSVIGIDLAKNIFHLHEVDTKTGKVIKKKFSRNKMTIYMKEKEQNQEKCLVGIEACGGSNYWARTFSAMGHEVRIIAPQFVKPYVTGNKNDTIDAAAIYEALLRPHMKFVPIKSSEQQGIQMLHRVRSRLVKQRTALGNEIRGFLHEEGIVFPKGHSQIRNKLPDVLKQYPEKFPADVVEEFKELYQEFLILDKKINSYEKRFAAICANDENCKRLLTIPGVGIITATAMVSAIGDISNFENSRQLSAWLGLVPKQKSTGGKNVLLGISKRGNKYLRQLLVHGGRSMIKAARASQKKGCKLGKLQTWAANKTEQKGYNKAAVAVANKLARIIWAVMSKNVNYRLA